MKTPIAEAIIEFTGLALRHRQRSQPCQKLLRLGLRQGPGWVGSARINVQFHPHLCRSSGGRCYGMGGAGATQQHEGDAEQQECDTGQQYVTHGFTSHESQG